MDEIKVIDEMDIADEQLIEKQTRPNNYINREVTANHLKRYIKRDVKV